MKRIILWLEDQYKNANIKNLQTETLFEVINDTLLKIEEDMDYGFARNISKNITICSFNDNKVEVSIDREKLSCTKTFENVISLKKGKYYWVRYKLWKAEIMQVVEKDNYISSCFKSIGSKNQYKLSDLTILQEVKDLKC